MGLNEILLSIFVISDHVGIVLRLTDDPQEVFIMHATFADIIVESYTDLKRKIGKGKFYEKFVFRHLEMQRTDKDLELLDRFYDEAFQCKFKLTPNVFNRITENSLPTRVVDRTKKVA